jgi:hypothetical protein
MSGKETEVFWRHIVRSQEHLISCMDGLSEDDINWRPLENANSLYVLATHMMSNMKETVLAALCGQAMSMRQRENDFKVVGTSVESVRESWNELKARIGSSLALLPPDSLDKEYLHPRRGKITGREILIVVAKHAAEHFGQAELTLDLLHKARGRPLPVHEF